MKNNYLIYFILCISILFTGCYASMFGYVKPDKVRVKYKETNQYDEFDKDTITELQGNTLYTESSSVNYKDYLYPTFEFNLRLYEKEDVKLYYIVIDLYTDTWLFIRAGESLVLLIDDKKMVFTGDGSSNYREVLYGGSIYERAYYKITKKQLKKIIKAKELKVKLIGSKYYKEAFATKDNLYNLKTFYDLHIKNK